MQCRCLLRRCWTKAPDAPQDRLIVDSPLEGSGFEPPVPLAGERVIFRKGRGRSHRRGLERRRLFHGGPSGSNPLRPSGESGEIRMRTVIALDRLNTRHEPIGNFFYVADVPFAPATCQQRRSVSEEIENRLETSRLAG